ncbi:MAG: hypothetical protein KAJ09_03035, partial [Deltaproteobacteria bacterium]|nr:hypothetical protein [Deltaproteobacteria bacterium]
FWWAGFQLDGKAGPVALKADFIYVDGDVDRSGIATFANPDLDYSGWCFYANASAPIGPVTVGGVFTYSTGNDVGDTVASADQDRDGFVVPPGSEARWIYTEGVVFWPSRVNDGVHINTTGFSGTQVSSGPTGGTWMAKLYASIKPLDWLKVTGYGMYIGDTVDDGNQVGNAVDYAEVTGLEDESDIGIEFGLITDIQIYKNLKYSIAGGYLIAGDALDSYTGVDVVPGFIADNDSPDNPWAIVSQLIFTF